MQAANYAKCSLAYEENKKKLQSVGLFTVYLLQLFVDFSSCLGGGREKQSLNLDWL